MQRFLIGLAASRFTYRRTLKPILFQSFSNVRSDFVPRTTNCARPELPVDRRLSWSWGVGRYRPPPPRPHDKGRRHANWSLAGLLAWLGFGGNRDEAANEESQLVVTIKRGILAVQEGEFKQAETIFHIALRMAADLGNRDAETYVYSLLANTALERGLLSQAERLFKVVMQRELEKRGEEAKENNAMVEISIKLARIFAARGDLAKAEKGFEFSANAQEKKVLQLGGDCDEDTLALYGMALDAQAQFHLSQARYAEAEANFRKAAELSSRVNGETHDQTLVVLNSVASALSFQGRHREAGALMDNILDVASSTESVFLPTFLINRGMLNLREGLRLEAGRLCSSALQVAQGRDDAEGEREARDCLETIQQLAGK